MRRQTPSHVLSFSAIVSFTQAKYADCLQRRSLRDSGRAVLAAADRLWAWLKLAMPTLCPPLQLCCESLLLAGCKRYLGIVVLFVLSVTVLIVLFSPSPPPYVLPHPPPPSSPLGFSSSLLVSLHPHNPHWRTPAPLMATVQLNSATHVCFYERQNWK